MVKKKRTSAAVLLSFLTLTLSNVQQLIEEWILRYAQLMADQDTEKKFGQSLGNILHIFVFCNG